MKRFKPSWYLFRTQSTDEYCEAQYGLVHIDEDALKVIQVCRALLLMLTEALRPCGEYWGYGNVDYHKNCDLVVLTDLPEELEQYRDAVDSDDAIVYCEGLGEGLPDSCYGDLHWRSECAAWVVYKDSVYVKALSHYSSQEVESHDLEGVLFPEEDK